MNLVFIISDYSAVFENCPVFNIVFAIFFGSMNCLLLKICEQFKGQQYCKLTVMQYRKCSGSALQWRLSEAMMIVLSDK